MVVKCLHGVKVDKGKKRLNDSAAKTPVSAKKAKASTPQKTGQHLFLFCLYVACKFSTSVVLFV